MPENVLEVGPQVFSVIAGLIVMIGAAFAFAFKYRPRSDKAGAQGHRPAERDEEGEHMRPDGYIDSFSGVISEAGGGVPLMASLGMIIVLATWLTYLILNWKG